MRRSEFALLAGAAAAMSIGLASMPPAVAQRPAEVRKDPDEESRQRKRYLQRQARKQNRRHR